jgi:hypothetical protein
MKDLFGEDGETITLAPPCPCGSSQFIVEKGSGPHAAHLRCADCARRGRWMSREDYAKWQSSKQQGTG